LLLREHVLRVVAERSVQFPVAAEIHTARGNGVERSGAERDAAGECNCKQAKADGHVVEISLGGRR